MRLRLIFLLVCLPFRAQATLTAQTSTSAFPGSPLFSPISFSNLTPTLSTGDYTLNGGGVNLYINTPGVAENFTSPGGQKINGTTPSGEGLVQGSLGGVYAAPVTGSNGATWTGSYLSTGYGDIVLTFVRPVYGFALLWGSVDASNELDVLSGGSVVGGVPVLGTLQGAILGSTIAPGASGSQTYGGSFYTEITSTVAFNQVYLTSGTVSFESADFDLMVPEPGSGLLALAGIVAILLTRRARAITRWSRCSRAPSKKIQQYRPVFRHDGGFLDESPECL